MHVEVGWHGRLDLIEELAELDGAMARIAFADHPSGGDVKGSEQRGGAMALVVVAAPRRLAGAHRQHGLAAVQRLDLRLLIDAKHDGVGRRRDVEADHIAHLGNEIRIAGEFESLKPVWLQAEGAPNALNAWKATNRTLPPCFANSNASRPMECSPACGQSLPRCGRHRSCEERRCAAHPEVHPRGARQSAGATCRRWSCRSADRPQPAGSPPRSHNAKRSAPATPTPGPCYAEQQAMSAPPARLHSKPMLPFADQPSSAPCFEKPDTGR